MVGQRSSAGDGRICESILDAVGRTPLVELKRLAKDWNFRVFGKLEGLNPGGSSKDRSAKLMIAKALEAGEIDRDTLVIESSSGNMGIGIAQACRIFGLKFVCVTDVRATKENI